MFKQRWVLMICLTGVMALSLACGIGTPDPPPIPTVGTGGTSFQSESGTGVYINGYELTPQERLEFELSFDRINPGRYWLDRDGNFGIEGEGFLVNLKALTEDKEGYDPCDDVNLMWLDYIPPGC